MPDVWFVYFSQARFWMQVVDELRRGVRLKKISFHHTPTEYELTPYEILMDDIRSRWVWELGMQLSGCPVTVNTLTSVINRKYNLRKVMVNGDIPPKVKKDAHAVILEFIRSRPPLRKVSRVFYNFLITLITTKTFFLVLRSINRQLIGNWHRWNAIHHLASNCLTRFVKAEFWNRLRWHQD